MEKNYFFTQPMRILVALTMFMLLLALGSYASLNFSKMEYSNPNPSTISVSGTGEVFAVPDIGRFSFSVAAEAETAAEAQELSGTKINTIYAYLKEQGIAEKDIKTENYNLYPRYRYEERTCATNSYCPPGERVADGFEVSQSIAVKIRKTDTAGAIIVGVGERGATNISSLDFTIDDTDILKVEARANAIADAQSKAVVLADQLGVRLVRMVYYTENEGGYSMPYAVRNMAMDSAEAAPAFGGAEMPVGEDTTTSQVTITYEVQ